MFRELSDTAQDDLPWKWQGLQVLGPLTSINNHENSPQVSMTGIALHWRRSTQVTLTGVKLTAKVTFNPSTREAEAGGSLRAGGQAGLQSEFQDRQQGYPEKPCLEKPKRKKEGRKKKKTE